jgi:hypothetical protein
MMTFHYEWHVFKEDWVNKRTMCQEQIAGMAWTHIKIRGAKPLGPWSFETFDSSTDRCWKVIATCRIRFPQISLA